MCKYRDNSTCKNSKQHKITSHCLSYTNKLVWQESTCTDLYSQTGHKTSTGLPVLKVCCTPSQCLWLACHFKLHLSQVKHACNKFLFLLLASMAPGGSSDKTVLKGKTAKHLLFKTIYTVYLKYIQ